MRVQCLIYVEGENIRLHNQILTKYKIKIKDIYEFKNKYISCFLSYYLWYVHALKNLHPILITTRYKIEILIQFLSNIFNLEKITNHTSWWPP